VKSRTLGVCALSAAALSIPVAPAAAAKPAGLKPSLAGHATVRAQMRDAAREIARERRHRRAERRARALRRREAGFRSVAVPAALSSIAACESGGNPAAIGGGGKFRGKYQFDYGTWASVGGSGDPAAASEAEQDMRAAMLYARAGSAPWPVCG
jgi:hypothetical protein